MARTKAKVSKEAIDEFMAAPWLKELDSAARTALLNVMEEHRSGVGSVILAQGEPNDHVLFLLKGTVCVTRKHGKGRRELVFTIDAPSILGLTSFFRPTAPNFAVESKTEAWYLTLDHPAHDLLRKVDVRASEQLALASVRVLSDRFDQLDQRLSQSLAHHPEGHPKVTEWAEFRSRLLKNNI